MPIPRNTDNDPLEQIIADLRCLPGIGPRSARRIAFFLCEHGHSLRRGLMDSLKDMEERITRCEKCHAMMLSNPCRICLQPDRDDSILCVVEHLADMLAMEETNIYRGQYHCLGGVLSGQHGVFAEDLTLDDLLKRASDTSLNEIILALPLTVDGQLTAHYLTNHINQSFPGLRISQLAHGIPVGGALDYLDEGTLHAAYEGRTIVASAHVERGEEALPKKSEQSDAS